MDQGGYFLPGFRQPGQPGQIAGFLAQAEWSVVSGLSFSEGLQVGANAFESGERIGHGGLPLRRFKQPEDSHFPADAPHDGLVSFVGSHPVQP